MPTPLKGAASTTRTKSAPVDPPRVKSSPQPEPGRAAWQGRAGVASAKKQQLDGLDPPVAAPKRLGAATIVLEELKAVMPGLSAEKATEFLPHLNAALIEGEVLTRPRLTAFLAQLAHESGELVHMEERASGARYEGSKDLGNTEPGDGKRFKGRGPIQLTGRANYRAAGAALGLDLVNHPEQVSTPEVGFRVAAWFWKKNGLNALADAGKFEKITRIINGGHNGQASRNRYYRLAQNALG